MRRQFGDQLFWLAAVARRARAFIGGLAVSVVLTEAELRAQADHELMKVLENYVIRDARIA